MIDFVTTTRIRSLPHEVMNKYRAHIQLTENRDLSKEEAINEMIVLAGQSTLPKEIVKALGIDKPIKK